MSADDLLDDIVSAEILSFNSTVKGVGRTAP